MFIKKLEYLFILLILSALSFLAFNYYQDYTFKHNPLPKSYMKRIENKEKDILQNMQKNFGFEYKFPIIITDKIPGRLYGLTSYENGVIKIYLNKKVMQESMDYMVESVLAHEYAHALLFALHKDKSTNDGHSKLWQQTCQKLGGKECKKYVNQHEVIISKMPFK